MENKKILAAADVVVDKNRKRKTTDCFGETQI